MNTQKKIERIMSEYFTELSDLDKKIIQLELERLVVLAKKEQLQDKLLTTTE